MDIYEAVDAYTIESAYASFDEKVKGRLMKGYLADLVVLSDNIFEVPSDCVLAAGGVLREGGITEFMAQSCAAFVGYRDFLAGRSEPSVGVLGALSRMKIGFLPPVGSKLSCRVETVGDFGGMQMFYAKVHMDGGRLVAEGRLTTSGLGNAE